MPQMKMSTTKQAPAVPSRVKPTVRLVACSPSLACRSAAVVAYRRSIQDTVLAIKNSLRDVRSNHLLVGQYARSCSKQQWHIPKK